MKTDRGGGSKDSIRDLQINGCLFWFTRIESFTTGSLNQGFASSNQALMLDEVIEYLKQLQAQVQMMSRMNMSPMMLPLAMQQQLQVPMMSPMGMARMGMAQMRMGFMDINTIDCAGMPPVLSPPPAAFMLMPSWDNPSN